MRNLKERSRRAPQRRRADGDEVTFFRGWLRRPLVMGAVSPSSRALGDTMAAFVPAPAEMGEDECVVELGPGTGVVTRSLVRAGVPESALILVEYSREFCDLLRARFPEATVLEADAYTFDLKAHEALAGRKVAAVVSSLPLFTRPEAMRERLVAAALDTLPPAAPFIQFSYALSMPVKAARIEAGIETSRWISRNLPPARVLVYRRGQPAPRQARDIDHLSQSSRERR